MLRKDHLPTNPLPVIAISPGIALGPVYLYRVARSNVEMTTISAEQVETELRRLQDALDRAIHDLNTISENLANSAQTDVSEIFEAQKLMLEDPDLLAAISDLITQQHYSAALALQQVVEQQAQELEALENNVLATRGADIRDAAAHVIGHLQGTPKLQPMFTHSVILVANDLTPSDAAKLEPKHILGICTVMGGPTTHAAIIARTRKIPAIAGIAPDLLDILHDGEQIALDGTEGLLYLQISNDEQQKLQAMMLRQQEEHTIPQEIRWHNLPGSTSDGVAVPILANVGNVEDAYDASEAGAEGIGLLRTEFLFGERSTFPSEQELFVSYVTLFRAFSEHATLGKTIVARTLDAGADKPLPALESLIGTQQEANPALGLRGIRIHLAHEELLRQQLRALLRAGVEAGIHQRIMFPMITTVEEVRRLRAIYTTVCAELQSEGCALLPDTQIGIMIETPAAALMADVLAREVDFFSIGANDLFQYTMAVDRTNSRIASMFGVLEPAIWRMIEQVVQASKKHGKTIALCGEIAADPRIAPLLVGLGVQELSMAPSAIATVKEALHQHPLIYWQELAQELLKAETAADMQRILQTIFV